MVPHFPASLVLIATVYHRTPPPTSPPGTTRVFSVVKSLFLVCLSFFPSLLTRFVSSVPHRQNHTVFVFLSLISLSLISPAPFMSLQSTY